MRKHLLKVTIVLMAALSPLGVTLAQDATPSLKVSKLATKSKAAKAQAASQKDFLAKHPLMAKRKTLRPRHSVFPTVRRQVIKFPNRALTPGKLFANASTTIWADLAYKKSWTQQNYGPLGYYSFSPTSPINFTSLFETDSDPAENGVQYKGGHLYGLALQSSDYGSALYLYDTDTETGKTTSHYLSTSDGANIKLIATETAQADDGTVYGEFYNEDGTAFEWGTVDYSTRTRTTIAPANNYYVALGITKEGQLYGIATDGNLYKINKSTGAESIVGATGLGDITNSQGQYYGQTGEIDQKDNTFYWAALKADGTGGLYEVNLETGAATLIDGDGNQLYGMYIPAPAAEDGAPAAVFGLAANFTGTSLTGTITFTAPSTTYGGAALSGNVNYTVKANDAVVATGSAAAGSAVTVNVTVPVSGSYNFEVTTSNAAGESPKAKVSTWVGFDAPLPVSDIKTTKSGQDITISWTAPTAGVHGGTLGALTYDVYRISGKDTVKVASDITATSFTDHITSSVFASYTYAVIAKSEGLESDRATSAGITAGSAIEPDWSTSFDTQEEFNLFTVVDANKDGKTWEYWAFNTLVNSDYNQDNGNDDWLFTPPLHFTPGREYAVSFKVRNQSSMFQNSIEVKWGTDTTAAAMTHTSVPTFVPLDKDSIYTFNITAPADGNYYIGFHDNTSEPNQLYLLLDDISVVKGILGTAPQAVTGLTVTPAELGHLQATISFNIPTLSVDGNSIQSVDSTVIYRDGERIAALPAAAAGSSQTYTDNAVPTNGIHTYQVVSFIGSEGGVKASASAFIGQDVPGVPQNVTLSDNGDNTLAAWDAFTGKGAKGGYIDPAKVSVSLFSLVEGDYGYEVGDSLTASEPGATRAELPQNPEQTTAEDGTTQTLYQVAARANSAGGSSSYVLSDGLIIGPSIQLPFKESLKDGKLDNGFAWLDGNEQWFYNDEAASWTIDADNTADGDGGSAFWKAYSDDSGWLSTNYTITAGDETSFNSPKISLRGATNPKLYFSLYATAGDPAQLKVDIETPDGVVHTAKTIDLSTTTTAGWTSQEVDLSQFASQRYVMVKFHGVATGSETVIGIDNINVLDQLEFNLRATGINAPANVDAGKSAKVDVYVENHGSQPANGYSVVLYADDQPVDTAVANKQLAVFASDTISLTLPIAINQTEAIKVKAEVVYDLDLDEDDNTTETKTVNVRPSEYTSVDNLSATVAYNNVSLSWSAPAIAKPVTVTDDFESYDAFATRFGDWTTYDGDKAITDGIFQGAQYPGEGTAFAFDIFNPNAIADGVVEKYPGLAPHSGNQFAGAPHAIDPDTQRETEADNWLVSPQLSGKAQTVTFYALNMTIRDDYTGSILPYIESFDVLYSTTDKNIESFTKIDSYDADGRTVIDAGPNWKLITVQIPEGAKYFAIHHNSTAYNSFLFGVDDVTFEKGAVGAGDSIVAYNIYRDGKLIATVKGDKATFTDGAADDGSHVYNITAVYQDKAGNRNESGFSNSATVTVTGIANITPDKDGKFNVYTVDGKAVLIGTKSLRGLRSGVYIINGSKYIIR